MNDSSRTQGLIICAGAAILGLVFALGLLAGAWWAVAIPVAILLAFVLGLTFWVGFTIATVQVDPEPSPDAAPSSEAAAKPGTETPSGDAS